MDIPRSALLKIIIYYFSSYFAIASFIGEGSEFSHSTGPTQETVANPIHSLDYLPDECYRPQKHQKISESPTHYLTEALAQDKPSPSDVCDMFLPNLDLQYFKSLLEPSSSSSYLSSWVKEKESNYLNDGTNLLWGQGEGWNNQLTVDPQQPNTSSSISSLFNGKDTQAADDIFYSPWGQGQELGFSPTHFPTNIYSFSNPYESVQEDKDKEAVSWPFGEVAEFYEGHEIGKQKKLVGNPLGPLPIKTPTDSQDDISDQEKIEMRDQKTNSNQDFLTAKSRTNGSFPSHH
ncbi:hypothetical protein PGT21_032796 [Puccinia graminis f. sp. tritici]|uniref:Uncharacterized protein n=1 Tax=Puccinia graminis f. sp. tritici TaxID=56615 RepID=A0A5B0QQN8_PUCGR|nr:hypothetical protein PGT21_032796 [Puccinia graminis f. sp. tritici]